MLSLVIWTSVRAYVNCIAYICLTLCVFYWIRSQMVGAYKRRFTPLQFSSLNLIWGLFHFSSLQWIPICILSHKFYCCLFAALNHSSKNTVNWNIASAMQLSSLRRFFVFVFYAPKAWPYDLMCMCTTDERSSVFITANKCFFYSCCTCLFCWYFEGSIENVYSSI